LWTQAIGSIGLQKNFDKSLTRGGHRFYSYLVSSSELSDFGKMLRVARERQGLTLQQISEITKISVSVLTAIESNDISQLPGGLFIRAFVRSYASEVGLDPEQIVNALLENYPEQRYDVVVRPRDELTEFRLTRKLSIISATEIGVTVISVIVVCLLLFFGLRSSNGSGHEGEVSSIHGVVADGVSPSMEVAPLQAVLPSPANGPLVSAPGFPATDSETGEPFRVAVHPTGPCWVSVMIDGERVFAGVVGAGERTVYEVMNEIVLNVGDAGAFKFSINQQLGRALGNAGQVVTVEIDRDNYRSFVTTQ
jgi:cytoskeleton protein RodZ